MSEHTDNTESGELTPKGQQKTIINSDHYPMRVLAGAGTGKTTTMVWKIEDLIADDVPPDEILALTFTNNAAGAMQQKVADQLDDPERAYDITATTYHAIANQLLTEHAYYADIDPDYDIVDEVEKSKLVYECLDEIPYHFTEPEVVEPDDQSFRSGVERALEGFISQFKSAKIKPDELDEYLPTKQALGMVGDLVSTLRNVADEQLYIHGNTTANSLDSERLNRVKNGLDTLISEIATCREAVADSKNNAILLNLVQDLETVLLNLQSRIEPLDAEGMTDKGLDYVRAPAYLLGQHSNPPGGLSEQDPRLIDRFEELVRDWQQAFDLKEGYDAYEQKLSERDLLDYDDLIFEVLKLFEKDSIGPALRDRYQYVVCDEFQDTDKAQFQLVQKLVGDDQLFVVGDDDQAIYEWRGANPSNIREDIENAYPALETHKLEYNYRSRPSILELANNMVEGIEKRSAAKELDPDREYSPDVTIATLSGDTAENEMEQVASAMEQLGAGTAPGIETDIEYGDMAVLVRKNSHAYNLISVLERRDIPYELGGDLASNSVGVETVIAYLKAVVNPDEEVQLARVLLLRYRIPDSDLDRLHQYNGPLIEALSAVPENELEAPGRVQTAHAHLTELRSRRETHSLSQLYTAMKQITNIEWFLTADERDELRYLDDLVERYADEPLRTTLSEEFIEHLRHSVSALVEDESEGAQPSEDVVTILTVHKAKGLEFPVVFMPRTEENTWGPSVRSNDRLLSKVEKAEVDPAILEEQEQRRVFHVGLTRTEDLLVLSSNSHGRGASSSNDSQDFDWGDIYNSLPDSSDLCSTDAGFPVWKELTEALPDGHLDWEDATETAVESDSDSSERYESTEAVDRIVDLLDSTLTGEVESVPITEIGLEKEALEEPASPEALRKHSYSAIDRFETCQRWHYLTNVVHAFRDPPDLETSQGSINRNKTTITNSADQTESVAPNIAGNIFHETAEQAAPDPDITSIADWEDVAKNVAKKYDLDHVPERVANCIVNYHESKLAEWDVVATEQEFELNLGESPIEERPLIVRGYIDAIYKNKGEYYTVDYKTSQTYSADHRRQAQIYMLACKDLFDYNISAGYIHYLNLGPDEMKPVEHPDGLGTIRDKVRDALAPLNNTSYAKPTAEEPSDCRDCPHNNLPCSLWPPEEAE